MIVHIVFKSDKMKLNAKLKGTKALQSKFDRFGKEGYNRVAAVTKIAAQEIELDAKQTAPLDTGKLRQGIKSESITDLSYRILAAEIYSAFIEFGTGGLVDVPIGWESLAIQFKGEGKRQVNLSPQPFLHPAFVKGSKQYKKDLKREFEKLTTKYSKK